MSNTFFKNHSTLVRNPEMPLHPPSLRSSILSLRSAFPHFLQKILVFKFQSFFPWLLCSKFCFTFWLRDPEPEKLFNFLKTDGCSVPFPHSHATTPTTGKPLTNLLAVNPLCGRVLWTPARFFFFYHKPGGSIHCKIK